MSNCSRWKVMRWQSGFWFIFLSSSTQKSPNYSAKSFLKFDIYPYICIGLRCSLMVTAIADEKGTSVQSRDYTRSCMSQSILRAIWRWSLLQGGKAARRRRVRRPALMLTMMQCFREIGHWRGTWFCYVSQACVVTSILPKCLHGWRMNEVINITQLSQVEIMEIKDINGVKRR